MGRGGKKKGKSDKEKVEPDVSSLSMTESEPSVSEKKEDPSTLTQSAGPATQEEPEEECGLGLSGGKKKRPRKKKKESTETEQEPKHTPTLGSAGPSGSQSAWQVASQHAPQPFAQQITPAAQSVPTPPAKPVPTSVAQPLDTPHAQSAPPQSPWGAQSTGPSAGWGRGQDRNQGRGQDRNQGRGQDRNQGRGQDRNQGRGQDQDLGWGRGRGRGRGLGPGPGRGWREHDTPQTMPTLSFPVPAPQQPSSSQTPSTSSAQEISSKAPESSQFKIPDRRPGRMVISQSRQLKVLTNYLEMKIQPLKIYRYDVSIKPDRPKKFMPKSFAIVKETHFPKNIIAFDQRKNCYSIEQLWKSSDDRFFTTVEVTDDNGGKMSFEVTIKFTGIVDFETIINHMRNGGTSLSPPMEAIQCVDVILQQGTLQSYVKAGRQFFKQPRNPIDLGYGLEMWTGLFQSAIFTSRPFINIDVAHKGFPRQQSLIDALTRDFNLDPRQPLDRQRGADYFIQFLKGLRVKANIGGGGRKREYICNSLVDPPNRLLFPMTDANGTTKTVTVEKYFEVDKKCRLRYPNLNCLWVGPRDKNIYYPIELLEISYGQAQNKQLNEVQLRTMVRQAATPPNDRLAKIREVISNMNYSANPCFKHFKLEVSNQFLQVDAKVLPAPKLDLGSGRTVDPRKGVWQANRFLKASALTAWGLIGVDIDTRRCDCQFLIDMMMRVAGSMGMQVAQPKFTNFSGKMFDLQKMLLTANDKNLNLLFVIVPARIKDVYDRVKRIAELDVGILTQCIKDSTVMNRINDQTIKNILLKVNSKLMGVNQALESRSIPQCIRDGSAMVVGADVTHPSPDQSNIPSIAAVTASYDPECFKYNIELSIQAPKHEIIVEFGDMMFDHLKVYKKHRNCLPKKIYVFRDGVSEGQFAQVMNSELVAIQRAYSRLEQNFKPEILFLLVQKRHHTRFFLGENNPQNVDPGTVVDTDIVHVRELDFYLVSHQAIKGTARPTRYHVVCNDGNIPSDEVEQLAYYLCHLYARCTRSVSYPAPTYYAHLACLRARSLTSENRYNNADLEKKPQRLRVLDRMLQHSRMFFI